MARAMLICALVAAAAVVALGDAAPNGIKVSVQFDNTLGRVKDHLKTVDKYLAERLCHVDGAALMNLGSTDQSSLVDHKSTAEFFCAGPDVKKLLSNCNGMWNRHELKDEIKDHTTPDIEVQHVLTCTPAYMPMGGRKML